MCKRRICRRKFAENVLRFLLCLNYTIVYVNFNFSELELLQGLSHPFISSLWYAFQVGGVRRNNWGNSRTTGQRTNLHDKRPAAWGWSCLSPEEPRTIFRIPSKIVWTDWLNIHHQLTIFRMICELALALDYLHRQRFFCIIYGNIKYLLGLAISMWNQPTFCWTSRGTRISAILGFSRIRTFLQTFDSLQIGQAIGGGETGRNLFRHSRPTLIIHRPPPRQALATTWPPKSCWPHWATLLATTGEWIGGHLVCRSALNRQFTITFPCRRLLLWIIAGPHSFFVSGQLFFTSGDSFRSTPFTQSIHSKGVEHNLHPGRHHAESLAVGFDRLPACYNQSRPAMPHWHFWEDPRAPLHGANQMEGCFRQAS